MLRNVDGVDEALCTEIVPVSQCYCCCCCAVRTDLLPYLGHSNGFIDRAALSAFAVKNQFLDGV